MPKYVKPTICKWCKDTEPNHYPYQCYKNPNRGKTVVRSYGKGLSRWMKLRRRWFQLNPKDYYSCYLCGKSLLPVETTLDHIIPRSRAPHLRYDLNNIQPACYKCNTEKGSKVYEENPV